jgi:hypothetical protein
VKTLQGLTEKAKPGDPVPIGFSELELALNRPAVCGQGMLSTFMARINCQFVESCAVTVNGQFSRSGSSKSDSIFRRRGPESIP